MSAPPSCWCTPDDHVGLLLHPLFPHAHGDARAEDGKIDGAIAVDHAPGISAAGVGVSSYDAAAGLLVPLLPSAMTPAGSRYVSAPEARPDQRALAPPIPPPRLAVSVARAI
jgi:hypothetical protein